MLVSLIVNFHSDHHGYGAAILHCWGEVPLPHRVFGISIGFFVEAIDDRGAAHVPVSLTTAWSVILPDLPLQFARCLPTGGGDGQVPLSSANDSTAQEATMMKHMRIDFIVTIVDVRA